MLAGFVQGILEGNDLILRNLHRADELLQNFRQVANDQTSEQRRSFDLAVPRQMFASRVRQCPALSYLWTCISFAQTEQL